MGKIKKRIYPQDITLNIGRGVPVPEHPFPGVCCGCGWSCGWVCSAVAGWHTHGMWGGRVATEESACWAAMSPGAGHKVVRVLLLLNLDGPWSLVSGRRCSTASAPPPPAVSLQARAGRRFATTRLSRGWPTGGTQSTQRSTSEQYCLLH